MPFKHRIETPAGVILPLDLDLNNIVQEKRIQDCEFRMSKPINLKFIRFNARI